MGRVRGVGRSDKASWRGDILIKDAEVGREVVSKLQLSGSIVCAHQMFMGVNNYTE